MLIGVCCFFFTKYFSHSLFSFLFSLFSFFCQYPSFVYPVPELVPALVVLITMAPKKSKSLGDDDLDDEGEEEGGDDRGCCCCCRSDGRRRWMSLTNEEEEEENTSTRFDSLLAFDVSNSVSSNESINGGGYNGNFSGIRKATPQRSRGWF